MALFGIGKKKNAPAEGIPTDAVIQMRQQGTPNDQIIQDLQKQGFSSSQIFDAMSQADIKGTVGGAGEVPVAVVPQQPQQMPVGMPLPEPAYEMPAAPAIDKTAIEEIAESIIDEKWEELIKNIDKIVAWKEATDVKMTKIEQKLKDLKERFETLHAGVLSKVSSYDKNIKNVGTDIKAMEEVFKKILPTFTSNVKELSRLTKKIKK